MLRESLQRKSGRWRCEHSTSMRAVHALVGGVLGIIVAIGGAPAVAATASLTALCANPSSEGSVAVCASVMEATCAPQEVSTILFGTYTYCTGPEFEASTRKQAFARAYCAAFPGECIDGKWGPGVDLRPAVDRAHQQARIDELLQKQQRSPEETALLLTALGQPDEVALDQWVRNTLDPADPVYHLLANAFPSLQQQAPPDRTPAQEDRLWEQVSERLPRMAPSQLQSHARSLLVQLNKALPRLQHAIDTALQCKPQGSGTAVEYVPVVPLGELESIDTRIAGAVLTRYRTIVTTIHGAPDNPQATLQEILHTQQLLEQLRTSDRYGSEAEKWLVAYRTLASALRAHLAIQKLRDKQQQLIATRSHLNELVVQAGGSPGASEGLCDALTLEAQSKELVAAVRKLQEASPLPQVACSRQEMADAVATLQQQIAPIKAFLQRVEGNGEPLDDAAHPDTFAASSGSGYVAQILRLCEQQQPLCQTAVTDEGGAPLKLYDLYRSVRANVREMRQWYDTATRRLTQLQQRQSGSPSSEAEALVCQIREWLAQTDALGALPTTVSNDPWMRQSRHDLNQCNTAGNGAVHTTAQLKAQLDRVRTLRRQAEQAVALVGRGEALVGRCRHLLENASQVPVVKEPCQQLYARLVRVRDAARLVGRLQVVERRFNDALHERGQEGWVCGATSGRPLTRTAQEVSPESRGLTEGLVRCTQGYDICKLVREGGGKEQRLAMCGPCMLLELTKRVVNFLIFLATIGAAISFVYAGVLFVSSPANPGNIQRAKGIFWTVLWGLIITLGAWIIVNTVFVVLTGSSFVNIPGLSGLCAPPHFSEAELQRIREACEQRGAGATVTSVAPTVQPSVAGGALWQARCRRREESQCQYNEQREQQVRAAFLNAGLQINKGPCGQTSNAPAGGCTEVGGCATKRCSI